MSYFSDYSIELSIGLVTLISCGLTIFILHWANFKFRHIEIAMKRKWPRMPRGLVKTLYISTLLLLIVPLFVIGWLLLRAWQETRFKAYTLTVGTGTLILTAFTTTVGFMCWKKAMWCLSWVEKLCFFLFIIEILVFLYAYDYLDEIFDYETHSVFFFVGSLVPMTLFVYSLSARSGLDLDGLYRNFLVYYRKKLKDRPPPQTEEVKAERREVPAESSKDEELNQEERKIDVNMINMSLVLSKASIKSGEMSHLGDIPRAFPGLQDTSIPMINERPEVTTEEEHKRDFQEILGMTRNSAKTSETLKCTVYLLITLAIYVTYNIEYLTQHNAPYTRIGLTQTFYLIYFDLVIIAWSRSYLANSATSITKSSILMLLCRVLQSINLKYWVITHCVIYVTLVSIIGTSLCEH